MVLAAYVSSPQHLYCFSFFFFQAEDGIRDSSVTGVQTCALPISYQTTYTPPTAMGDANGNMCMNYLGDSGISGLGTTVGSASYSFTVAPNSNFVIVVNTTAGSTNSSVFSGTVSGFIDNTPGPGDCATIPPELTGAVSRKTHGNLPPPPPGPGDLGLNLNPSTPTTIKTPMDGRTTGAHTLSHRYSNTLTS